MFVTFVYSVAAQLVSSPPVPFVLCGSSLLSAASVSVLEAPREGHRQLDWTER